MYRIKYMFIQLSTGLAYGNAVETSFLPPISLPEHGFSVCRSHAHCTNTCKATTHFCAEYDDIDSLCGGFVQRIQFVRSKSGAKSKPVAFVLGWLWFLETAYRVTRTHNHKLSKAGVLYHWIGWTRRLLQYGKPIKWIVLPQTFYSGRIAGGCVSNKAEQFIFISLLRFILPYMYVCVVFNKCYVN